MQNTVHIFKDAKGNELLIPLTGGIYQLPSCTLNYTLSIRASFINLLNALSDLGIHLTKLDYLSADAALRAVNPELASQLSILNSFYLVKSLLIKEIPLGYCSKSEQGNYPLFSHFGKTTNLPTLLLTVFNTELKAA